MTFSRAFGLTAYSSGLSLIMADLDITMEKAILGFSLYLFGIFFAPIFTPHLAERYGRSILYLLSIFVCGLFHLGAALSPSFASLAVCRFLAGLAGGPCLVLIEGTFGESDFGMHLEHTLTQYAADVWSAETTNTYYAFLGCASYFGAASGPVVGNFVVFAGSGNWRWAEYTTLMLILVVFAFGIGMPETYGREIPRRRNKTQGRAPPHQPPAESGITLRQMAIVTVVNPARQLLLEPIVAMISFTLALNWAVTFQW